MRAIRGVVLAGGRGRRMGRSKGDLPFEGMGLAERAAAVLRHVCGDAVVSVGPSGSNPAPELPVVRDDPPAGRGPLAGIDAAFRMFTGCDLLVLACDYPWASERLLRAVAEAGRETGAGGSDSDLVMPRDDSGRDHPLVALWRNSAADAVERALAAGTFSVLALCGTLRVRRLTSKDLSGVDLALELTNWNRPEDMPWAPAD